MGVSAVSSSQGLDQTQSTRTMSQGKKDFEALQKALDSGDLDAAKSAFETIKKNKPSGPPPGPPPGGAQGGGQGGGDDPFAKLEEALSSGSLDSAKEIFAAIQDRMENGRSAADDSSQGATAVASRSVSTDLVGSLFDATA